MAPFRKTHTEQTFWRTIPVTYDPVNPVPVTEESDEDFVDRLLGGFIEEIVYNPLYKVLHPPKSKSKTIKVRFTLTCY
jgi:hypothetical protein